MRLILHAFSTACIRLVSSVGFDFTSRCQRENTLPAALDERKMQMMFAMPFPCMLLDVLLEKVSRNTSADAPSWGRALALAGMYVYAGNHWGMPCTQANHD